VARGGSLAGSTRGRALSFRYPPAARDVYIHAPRFRVREAFSVAHSYFRVLGNRAFARALPRRGLGRRLSKEAKMPRRSLWTIPFAVTVAFLVAGYHGGARAVPIDTQALNAAAPGSNVQLAQARRGPRGGVAVRGPRGGVAARGPRGATAVRGPRGRAAVRGPRGRVAVRGGPRARAYRVGGRYYGGVWFGPRRHFWRGRWWPYGVGSCWRRTPIGFVWVCG
jgi:hypothetical protein